MYAYQPIFRAPAFAPPRYQPPALGQTKPQEMGQLSPESRGLFVAGGLISTALSGAAAWVGVVTGIREKGFLSAVGWTVGVLFGLRAVIGLGATALVGTGVIAQEKAPAQPLV